MFLLTLDNQLVFQSPLLEKRRLLNVGRHGCGVAFVVPQRRCLPGESSVGGNDPT